MAGFTHVQRAVHPALRPYVGDISGYAYDGAPPELHRGLPSQYLTLVITLDEPLGIAWPDGTSGFYDAGLSGLHSQAVHVGGSTSRAGVQLALTPAAARALFGLPPGELAWRVVELEEIFGSSGAQLISQLRSVVGWRERFDLLEGALLRRWATPPASGVRAEVGWAWRRLCETGGAIGVQELAAEVGWSRRHLTERFGAEYGLAPKVAGRVLRFEQAVARLRQEPTLRLAELAATFGYADQAHLTREWQAIAGCTPRRWMREELPNVQDRCTLEAAESGV
ncbi:AraC family transcriptional regulator [Kribbella sandramycini]|uniref:AraC family transcriptional regulator n=1 Tax=Kribbella sandramycini TaxID=60450 RepID=A0A7Y4KVL3_9ACTN|nr:helix-turn-helix domain-containing protein [Kribbella sandramycini]MBB6568598.1 AraC-like DNA-binding protein [Kribbella sandramycini]NOL38817.1 AraC family transcriptional regulator [Kribbella sandramycini]